VLYARKRRAASFIILAGISIISPETNLVSKSIAAILVLGLASGVTMVSAQATDRQQKIAATPPFDRQEAVAAVEKLARALEENFVFPEVGKRYAAALRAKLAAGTYSSFSDAKGFADRVTADLQAIHSDGHLRLHAPEQGSARQSGIRRGLGPESSIERSGWLADGVAYISFTAFPGNDATLSELRQFLSSHASARTVIIDARGHRGGGLAEMDLMFPLFYDRPQALVQMDTRVAVEQRQGSPFSEGATLVRASGPQGVVRRTHRVVPAQQETALRRAKIFLLTSKRTASAAEHLALSLKRTGRATLIGETTRGAGHYGGIEDLGGGYSAFIPVGRTFDPDTNQGWEGSGVKPDVEVPADQALDEALRRTGVAAGTAKPLAELS
jgi:hypothetical protein